MRSTCELSALILFFLLINVIIIVMCCVECAKSGYVTNEKRERRIKIEDSMVSSFLWSLCEILFYTVFC